MFTLLPLMAVVSAQSPLPNDAKAADAVAAFSSLCVNMFVGETSDIDPARFNVTKLDEDTVREVKPEQAGRPLWDVTSKASDAHMLVHYEPTGMCVVEVHDADEAAIRASYLGLVDQTALRIGQSAKPQTGRVTVVDGKNATSSMWRIDGGPKGSIALTITTYPVAKFMIQHLMTASYVR
ncbi:MAG: hypothetical protein V4618_00430 [Pseudomonadota bacterium]